MRFSVRKSTAPNDLRFLTADFVVRQAHQPDAVRNDRCESIPRNAVLQEKQS